MFSATEQRSLITASKQAIHFSINRCAVELQISMSIIVRSCHQRITLVQVLTQTHITSQYNLLAIYIASKFD